jgi:hypothetical protein
VTIHSLSPRPGYRALARRTALLIGAALLAGSVAAPATAAAAAADDDDSRRHGWRDRDRDRYDDDDRDRDRWRHRDRDRDRDRGDWRHDRGRHRGWYKDRDRGHYDRRHEFEVPRHIARHRDYERYYHGRVYDRPHRHYHPVYAFPVYGPRGVVYEPHAYCGDTYYGRGAFHYDGPRLSIRWLF